MEIYVAKVLNGKAVAKEYGVDKSASYVAAPSGKLFRGFTQNILEVVSFGGIRFFTLEADLKGVIVVPEDILRGAIDGDETLAAVQKKLAAYINGRQKNEEGIQNPDTVLPAGESDIPKKDKPGK